MVQVDFLKKLKRKKMESLESAFIHILYMYLIYGYLYICIFQTPDIYNTVICKLLTTCIFAYLQLKTYVHFLGFNTPNFLFQQQNVHAIFHGLKVQTFLSLLVGLCIALSPRIVKLSPHLRRFDEKRGEFWRRKEKRKGVLVGR